MNTQRKLALFGLASTLVLAGALSQAREPASEFGALATPPGITVQPMGLAQGYSMNKESATILPREQIVFSNAHGMSLYTRKDGGACEPECLTDFAPYLAAADAKPVGAWSLVKRSDGAQQWALNGKAVYTYAKDEDPGSVGGNSPKRFGRGPSVGTRGSHIGPIAPDKPTPDGWAAAMLYPVAPDAFPAGFIGREVEDAGGLTLTTATGRTIYALDGNLKQEKKLCATIACDWKPLAAPQLASAKGDFAFVVRDDGIRQWTFKGRPLYTFARDMAPGEANGVLLAKEIGPALVSRFFVPEGVITQPTKKLGRVFATATGQTLYKRNGFIFQSGSGHNLRRGDTVRPAVGRDLGANPRCRTNCDAWHPYLAPDDAQPQGYWSVYTRDDGKKQWAYQGYALWTFDGDTRPGDILGNDTYDLALSHDTETLVDIGTPYDWPTALYWIVAYP